MNLALPVHRVSDTAFVTAVSRALETERPDAHFRDPQARLLAGSHGEELLKILPGSEYTVASCVIRTCVLDELLLRTLQEDDVDTIVNLGAGLDTRPYRLPLPSSLRWVDVDHAAVLDYKGSKLDGQRPACELEYLPLDIADPCCTQALAEEVGGDGRRILVLTEGLIVYMTRRQVAELALILNAKLGFRWWLTDLISQEALMLMNQSLVMPGGGTVRLQFAPQEGAGFFEQFGWQTDELRSCLEEGRRLDRWFLTRALLSITIPGHIQDVLRRLFTVILLKSLKSR